MPRTASTAALGPRLYAHLPVFAQNWACSWVGRRLYRARMNEHFHAMLAEWERTGSRPVEALREIQRGRLARLVEAARLHSPHYRDLPPASAAPDPLRAIEETLAAIPPLEKEHYRSDPESFLSRRIDRRRLIKGKTSGTTGTALPLWYTPEALGEEYATVWRQRRGAGAELRQPNLTFNGQMIVPFEQSRPPFWRHNAYGRQTLFSIFHMKPENLGAYVDAVHELPARFVQGYPSSIHQMAEALLAADRPLPPGRIVAVFTSSESLLAFHRETIEKAFQAPVRDRYGVSEFAVSMTECAERQLHLDMEFSLAEVEPVEETEEFVRGPLLVTGFANEATPFLRYRVGDVGTRSKRPCPCGRPGDVFLEVEGRIEDYVVTPDGRRIGRLDHIFKEQLDIAEAQIRQEDADAVEVWVVPRASYGEASEQELLREVRARLGPEIAIGIRRLAAIPREANGKFRAVKSRVGRMGPAGGGEAG